MNEREKALTRELDRMYAIRAELDAMVRRWLRVALAIAAIVSVATSVQVLRSMGYL